MFEKTSRCMWSANRDKRSPRAERSWRARGPSLKSHWRRGISVHVASSENRDKWDSYCCHSSCNYPYRRARVVSRMSECGRKFSSSRAVNRAQSAVFSLKAGTKLYLLRTLTSVFYQQGQFHVRCRYMKGWIRSLILTSRRTRGERT